MPLDSPDDFTFHPKFFWFVGLAAFVILNVFCAAIWFATRVAPVQNKAAAVVWLQFLDRSKARDYEGARSLCTMDYRGSPTAARLREKWQRFERKNGPFTTWRQAGGGRPRGGVNIWPREINFDTYVLGPRMDRGRATARLVLENDRWRLQNVEIYP